MHVVQEEFLSSDYYYYFFFVFFIFRFPSYTKLSRWLRGVGRPFSSARICYMDWADNFGCNWENTPNIPQLPAKFHASGWREWRHLRVLWWKRQQSHMHLQSNSNIWYENCFKWSEHHVPFTSCILRSFACISRSVLYLASIFEWPV